MAKSFEKKKDAMRAIRTKLKYRGLDVEEAARLMELARKDPEEVFEELIR